MKTKQKMFIFVSALSLIIGILFCTPMITEMTEQENQMCTGKCPDAIIDWLHDNVKFNYSGSDLQMSCNCFKNLNDSGLSHSLSFDYTLGLFKNSNNDHLDVDFAIGYETSGNRLSASYGGSFYMSSGSSHDYFTAKVSHRLFSSGSGTWGIDLELWGKIENIFGNGETEWQPGIGLSFAY